MALNSGLNTVKDILADIKTVTSKDESHTGTHVLLAKTKAGKFAGSITWITSTDKKSIDTKRVRTNGYNAHSLNFFMILREEEINVVYQSLTRFISDVQSPEFDKAVRMGSLPDLVGFIPTLIRTTNTVYQDLVKYFHEFFAELPERENLVWEYAYEPPLDKPLIALPTRTYKYWGNKFLNQMVEHIARESPKDRLAFTLMATNPLTKTNLLLSFIITNQPNPDNDTIAYADKASGVTIYLSCGTSDPRWFMVIFKCFVWALCNDCALTYPTLKDRVKALAGPSGANSEKLMHYLEEFFKMFGFQLPKVSDLETLQWDFLYGTYSETWSWFVDEQFNPLSKNTLPEEKELDVSDKNLVEKISDPHYVLKEQIGLGATVVNREYGCCTLGTFKNAKLYFVDSLKGLRQLEADLKRTDLVKSERRDMEQWFDYPEPRGKTIRLNNFDSVMVLHYGECKYQSGWKKTTHSVIAHEALHVVLSLCKHINYNPLNEQEPAAYAMEFITLGALGYYLPRMERISE